MVEYDRGDGGKFAFKSGTARAVRSIRLTDATWDKLEDKADEHGITKADYLEALFSGEIDWESDDSNSDENELDFDKDEVIEKLKSGLELKGNVSKKLKLIMKEILEIMGEEMEEEEE